MSFHLCICLMFVYIVEKLSLVVNYAGGEFNYSSERPLNDGKYIFLKIM